jgi:L-lactate dehydrogenase
MRVSIVGTGRTGVAAAFALLVKGLADELVLANRNVDRARAEAMDLAHASALTSRPPRITAGGIEATAASDVLVMCASAQPKGPVRSRTDLASVNTALFAEQIPKLCALSPNALLLVVTNPVDLLTFHALKLSGFAPQRVFGTGTLIDSARFRLLLSQEEGIHPDDVRSYVLGEHGPHQFPAMRIAAAGGERLEDPERDAALHAETLRSAEEVFRVKGYTSHAIALAVAMIVESIVHNALHTMPLSVAIDGYQGVSGVCLSVPVVVGRAGIVRRLSPELSLAESAHFLQAAKSVRAEIERFLPAELVG